MSEYMKRELELCTEVLRTRVASKSQIDINVLSPEFAESPRFLQEHLGRILGFFGMLPDGNPAFFTFGRKEIEGELSHMIVFYIADHHQQVAQTEVERFQGKLPKQLEYGVANVSCDTHCYFHLSALIQVLEFAFNPRLVSDFKKVIHFNCNMDIEKPLTSSCQLHCNRPRALALEAKFVRTLADIGCDYKTVNLSDPSAPNVQNFYLLKIIMEGGHCIFAINYQPIKVLALLVFHPHGPNRSLDSMLNSIGRKVPSISRREFNWIGFSRYFSDGPAVDCYSEEALKACFFAIRIPSLVVKKCEVDHILPEGWLDICLANEGLDGRPGFSTTNYPPPNATNRRTQVSASGSIQRTANIKFTEPLGEIELDSKNSSRAHIVDPSDIVNELQLIKAMEELKTDLWEMKIPPVACIQPRDDPNGRILHNAPLFLSCLRSYVNLWQAYTKVLMLDPIELTPRTGRINIEHGDERFVVLPITKTNRVTVFIIDLGAMEWAYLNPFFASDSRKKLREETLEQVQQLCPLLNNYPGREIALTSQFHTAYSKIHVLMGIFYIGRFFKYAVALPKRLIYGEREFRHFCWRICKTLQVKNMGYNEHKNYIKSNGYYRQGALRSMPSPVHYTAAVVPVDQCPFCLKRNFNNLGRHMSMAHGGQALAAREMRRYREDMDLD